MSVNSVQLSYRSLVDVDVLDDQLFLVEVLGVSVGLGVLQQVQDVSDGLFGPST